MDFGPQPRSATHFGINLCALIVGLATVGSLVHRMQGDLEPVAIVLLTTAAVGLVIAAGELWWRRGGLAPDAGLAASAIRTLDVRRVLTRLFGLGGSRSAASRSRTGSFRNITATSTRRSGAFCACSCRSPRRSP